MTNTDLRTSLLAKIQTIIEEVLAEPGLAITETSTAADVPGWDSLTHVQIIVAVEKAFGIRLKSAEIAELEDVGSLIDILLARKLTV